MRFTRKRIEKDYSPTAKQLTITGALLIFYYSILPTILKPVGLFTFGLFNAAANFLTVIWGISLIIGAFATDSILKSRRIKKFYQLWFTIANIITIGWFVFLITTYTSYLLNNIIVFLIIIVVLLIIIFKDRILKTLKDK